jgi:hypothetical protein
MQTETHARIVVEVNLGNDKFIATDEYSSRDSRGERGRVEIHKVSTTMSTLHGDTTYWAEGVRVRADGTVGTRRASQVLLDERQMPASVLREIRLAYLSAVKELAAEAGFLSD